MRLCSVSPLAPAAAAARKCAARKARLSLRVSEGGSCCRMCFSVCASGPPGTSGAMSHPASRDRSSFTADTYPQMVSARIASPVLPRSRDPHCRMNSAKSTNVWLLYRAPPSSAGLTNGVRTVEARKSANHSSAVAVRRAAVASITRARAAT
eukprot:4858172-Pleurochrysis_carterae.AAC.1